LAAAARSNACLAFERAAELYQSCIALSPPAQTADLWNKLAIALVHCRQGAKAAEAYLEVAKRAPPDKALECKQLAVSHLLRSGHFAEAQHLMHEVLSQMGASMPESEGAVLAALLWERAKLKLRGMKYTPCPRPEPKLLAHHDVFHAFGAGLQAYDLMGATLLSLRAMRCALDAGEPSRIARTFCLAAVGIATEGSARASQQVDALLASAEAVASELSEQAHGEVCASRAISVFMLLRFRDVLEPAAQAKRLLRGNIDDPHGNYHRRNATLIVRLISLLTLGHIREASAEVQELVEEAHATENRSLLVVLSPLRVLVDLANDRALSWRQRLDEQARSLPRDHFGQGHLAHLNALMHHACASGEHAWANACLDELWPRFLRSPLAGSSSMAMEAYQTRARLMLNQYASVRRPELLLAAKKELKAFARFRYGHSCAAKRIEARLALAAGERESGAKLFRAGASDWAERDFPVEAARDAFAAGVLLGGERGAAEQSAALERLRELGLVNPLSDLRTYTPELF
jgi:hypothetical protein